LQSRIEIDSSCLNCVQNIIYQCHLMNLLYVTRIK